MIASAAHCDVTNKAEVDALVNWTVQTYGAIDLLIANAGIVKGADFLDMTETDFDDVVRVNLKGVFLVSMHCFLGLCAAMGLSSNFLSLLQLSTTGPPLHTAMTCAWPSQLLKLTLCYHLPFHARVSCIVRRARIEKLVVVE